MSWPGKNYDVRYKLFITNPLIENLPKSFGATL